MAQTTGYPQMMCKEYNKNERYKIKFSRRNILDTNQNPWVDFIKGESRVNSGAMLSIINSNGNLIERSISIGDLVDCYRNLNKPEYFSCKQRKGENKNKVIGYGKIIVLKTPVFKVSEAGRQRVLKKRQKNVHAYVTGKFCDAFDGIFMPDQTFTEITYNPYDSGVFFNRITGDPIEPSINTKYAVLSGSNVYLSNFKCR